MRRGATTFFVTFDSRWNARSFGIASGIHGTNGRLQDENRARLFPWPSWPAWWFSSSPSSTCSAAGALSAPADLTLCNGDEPQTLDPAHRHGPARGAHRPRTVRGPDHAQCQRATSFPAWPKAGRSRPTASPTRFIFAPGIKWSNGDPLTAYDFLNSWKRVARIRRPRRNTPTSSTTSSTARPMARARSLISRRSA